MARALRRTLAAALLALAGAAVPAQASDEGAAAVVGTRSPADAARVASVLRREGLKVSIIPRIGALAASAAGVSEVRAMVGGDPRVSWVEPERTRTLLATSPDATVDPVTGRVYGWALDAVDSTEALSLAPPSLPVTVAVVDSGVDVGHPDLAGRIGSTFDVLTGGAAVKDLVGHGTFVAGLIAAVDGNALGSRGVAGPTTLLPIRVTTTGTVKSTDAATGIVRAVDAGAGVVNLSFGGPTVSDVEKSALAYAASKDVLVVAAAGNGYRTGNAPQYPAAVLGGVKGGWSTGLSVAATDPLGRHAPFSTSGDFVSVAAPGAGSGTCGDGVFSTLPADSASLWDGSTASPCMRVVTSMSTATGRWGYGEGTSFAAPLVAGAAALARDANPDLTAEQTADVIRRSAHQTIGTGWNPMTGAGVLDAGAAVALARVYDTAEPEARFAFAAVPGAVSVDLRTEDEGREGAPAAGVATVLVDRSTDGGSTWTAVGSTGAAGWHYDDHPAPNQTRWYRATVCDVNHNCTTEEASTDLQPKPDAVVVRTVAPAFRVLRTTRPGGCRACLRLTLTAGGTGRVAWTVVVSSRTAGVRTARRGGSVAAGRRLTVRLPLSRVPACRSVLRVTIRLTSPAGSVVRHRTIAVRGSCRAVGRHRR